MRDSEKKKLVGTLCLNCPMMVGAMPTESSRAHEVCCGPEGKIFTRPVVSDSHRLCPHTGVSVEAAA